MKKVINYVTHFQQSISSVVGECGENHKIIFLINHII